jgi:hypothetical protein
LLGFGVKGGGKTDRGIEERGMLGGVPGEVPGAIKGGRLDETKLVSDGERGFKASEG